MGVKNSITTSDYLEYSEFERLCSCLHKDRRYVMELYARVSFCTALRSSDVLTLRWRDVMKGSFTIREQKTQKVREIFISNEVKNYIHEIYNHLGQPDASKLMFLNRTGDKAMSIQYINKELKRIKEKYNIKIGNFSTHTFRKTFGRYVYERNNKSAESLILLNSIFKHANLSTTEIYIGIRREEIKNIFNSIKF